MHKGTKTLRCFETSQPAVSLVSRTTTQLRWESAPYIVPLSEDPLLSWYCSHPCQTQ